MTIRFQLKNYRLSKNYTQQYIADRLFISRQQYCNIENGKTEKISEDNKQKLAELLDIPGELMDRMDILVYTKNGSVDDSDPAIKYNYDNEQLLESLKEQNKHLILLLEKLAEKLD